MNKAGFNLFQGYWIPEVYHRPADLNTPATKLKNITNTANHTSSGTTQPAMSIGTATRLGLMVAGIARVYISRPFTLRAGAMLGVCSQSARRSRPLVSQGARSG
jgi:hypothetical protein